MSQHQKRLAQPRRWTLPKKLHKWAPKTRPGPHAIEDSLPLLLVVRDALHLADRAREARRIINDGKVLIDGKVCRETRRGIGLMDVVSIPELDQHYRALFDTHGRISLVRIEADKAAWKLGRIESKTTLAKGRTQLHLHDGRNVVVKEDEVSTGDVLRLKLPDQEVIERFPFEPGAVALITGGSHTGELAKVVEQRVVRSSSPNLVAMEGVEAFETIRPYVFVVGTTDPVIQLPEVTSVA